jgi:hypothetical protein
VVPVPALGGAPSVVPHLEIVRLQTHLDKQRLAVSRLESDVRGLLGGYKDLTVEMNALKSIAKRQEELIAAQADDIERLMTTLKHFLPADVEGSSGSISLPKVPVEDQVITIDHTVLSDDAPIQPSASPAPRSDHDMDVWVPTLSLPVDIPASITVPAPASEGESVPAPVPHRATSAPVQTPETAPVPASEPDSVPAPGPHQTASAPVESPETVPAPEHVNEEDIRLFSLSPEPQPLTRSIPSKSLTALGSMDPSFGGHPYNNPDGDESDEFAQTPSPEPSPASPLTEIEDDDDDAAPAQSKGAGKRRRGKAAAATTTAKKAKVASSAARTPRVRKPAPPATRRSVRNHPGTSPLPEA